MNYIVYSPSYNENNGGSIFKHTLVHTLNEMGERAFLWPGTFTLSKRKRLKDAIIKPPYPLYPDLNTPVARRRDLTASSIVIYPEITLGNPLRARNVVRWLLYKPGLRHPYQFGPDEMFFRAGEMSDLPEITGGAPDLFMWKINRTYRNKNRLDRNGVCYIVRKGKDKARIPETEVPGAIQIDKKSHAEINEIFNRCHTFYSYDEATMYSQYAAICGCLSIVVPGLYDTHEEWVANHSNGQYGIAYGLAEDKLAHAKATQCKVLEHLQEREAASLKTVERFIEMTKVRFGTS